MAARNTLVGLAGASSIVFFEAVHSTLTSHHYTKGLGVWFALVLGTFSVYILAFQLLDYLDRRILWRWFSHTNISGEWRLRLTNLQDQSTRDGEVQIRQDRDAITAQGFNRRPEAGSDPYSTWSSRLVVMTANHLFILYEIESTRDSDQTKYFKRGVIRLQLPASKGADMVGDFYDNAPSADRGPIILERVRK